MQGSHYTIYIYTPTEERQRLVRGHIRNDT
jgi:hypothetical protein